MYAARHKVQKGCCICIDDGAPSFLPQSGAQLRELRDRKRAQRDVAQEEADGARMPPPPPRPKPSAPAEFHADSQLTQVQTPPHQATTEPSVNQQPETTLPREHSVTSEYHAPRAAASAKGPEAEVGDSEAGAPGVVGASLPKGETCRGLGEKKSPRRACAGEVAGAHAASDKSPCAFICQYIFPKLHERLGVASPLHVDAGFFENAQAQSKAVGEKPPSKEQMAEVGNDGWNYVSLIIARDWVRRFNLACPN